MPMADFAGWALIPGFADSFPVSAGKIPGSAATGMRPQALDFTPYCRSNQEHDRHNRKIPGYLPGSREFAHGDARALPQAAGAHAG
jgi:hypothetical protein